MTTNSVRGVAVQELLRSDSIGPEPTLLDSRSYVPKNAFIDARRYYDREFHELEIEKVWSRTWQFAAWIHDLPRAGDIAVYRNAGKSVLIARMDDGTIKAYLNACLHRGRELCTRDLQHQSALRCPYHGFTWDLRGKLKSVPNSWDFGHIETAQLNLPEVRCEEWNGFIFINLDDDAPSLHDYMGKMVEHFAASKTWDFSNRYRAVNVVKHLNLNWKTAMEGFLDAFHTAASHPQLLAVAGDEITQYDVWENEPHFSRMIVPMGVASTNLKPCLRDDQVFAHYIREYLPELEGTPAGGLRDGESAREGLARLTVDILGERLNVDLRGKPASWLLDSVEYFLFPHFMIWPTFGAPIVYRFRPDDDPEKCIWETMIFLPFDGERPPSGPTVVLGSDESMAEIPELGFLGPVLQQDVDNLEPMQRGIRSLRSQKIFLGEYQEAQIRHFHETLSHYVGKE